MLGVSSVVLNRAAQSLMLLPLSIPASAWIGEWPNGLSHLCTGSQLQLPVYPHLLLCWFPLATGLWLSDVMWYNYLCITWIIVKESCTYVSLTPSSKTIWIQQEEQVMVAGDRVRCSGWLWFAKCLITPSTFHNMLMRCAFLVIESIEWLPLHNPLNPVFTCAFLSVESIEWLPLHNPLSPAFTCKGRHVHVSSRARAQQWTLTRFCWLAKVIAWGVAAVHADSYEELLVRAGCHVETNVEGTFHKEMAVPHQRCYSSMACHTALIGIG